MSLHLICRYYYDKNILAKIPKKLYAYRFDYHAMALACHAQKTPMSSDTNLETLREIFANIQGASSPSSCSPRPSPGGPGLQPPASPLIICAPVTTSCLKSQELEPFRWPEQEQELGHDFEQELWKELEQEQELDQEQEQEQEQEMEQEMLSWSYLERSGDFTDLAAYICDGGLVPGQ